LYIKKGIPFKPLLLGGGQQDGVRSGTLNMPAIAGYAKAIEFWKINNYAEQISVYKTLLWKALSNCPDCIPIGQDPIKTAPHIMNLAFKGIQAAVLQSVLEQRGILVGKGSACASRNARVSRILTSMKVPAQLAQGAIRFSIGAFNELVEINQVAEIITDELTHLRKFRRK
jgi:cysteine desulfurase